MSCYQCTFVVTFNDPQPDTNLLYLRELIEFTNDQTSTNLFQPSATPTPNTAGPTSCQSPWDFPGDSSVVSDSHGSPGRESQSCQSAEQWRRKQKKNKFHWKNCHLVHHGHLRRVRFDGHLDFDAADGERERRSASVGGGHGRRPLFPGRAGRSVSRTQSRRLTGRI